MDKSINYVSNGMRIINILPVELRGEVWYCVAFEPVNENMGDAMHIAFVYVQGYDAGTDLLYEIQNINLGDSPVVRFHSECLLGDAFGSSLCDCGEQLDHAMEGIIQNKSGVLVYLRQEGRGIGMRAKLACLAVQEGYVAGRLASEKLSSDEANLVNGYPIDNREYSMIPKILNFLNINRITVFTGNPEKLKALHEAGIIVDKVTDVSKSNVIHGSRKHKELLEKVSRNYQYEDLK